VIIPEEHPPGHQAHAARPAEAKPKADRFDRKPCGPYRPVAVLRVTRLEQMVEGRGGRTPSCYAPDRHFANWYGNFRAPSVRLLRGSWTGYTVRKLVRVRA